MRRSSVRALAVFAFALSLLVAFSVSPASAGRQVAGVTYCDPVASSPFNSVSALTSAAPRAAGPAAGAPGAR